MCHRLINFNPFIFRDLILCNILLISFLHTFHFYTFGPPALAGRVLLLHACSSVRACIVWNHCCLDCVHYYYYYYYHYYYYYWNLAQWYLARIKKNKLVRTKFWGKSSFGEKRCFLYFFEKFGIIFSKKHSFHLYFPAYPVSGKILAQNAVSQSDPMVL